MCRGTGAARSVITFNVQLDVSLEGGLNSWESREAASTPGGEGAVVARHGKNSIEKGGVPEAQTLKGTRARARHK